MDLNQLEVARARVETARILRDEALNVSRLAQDNFEQALNDRANALDAWADWKRTTTLAECPNCHGAGKVTIFTFDKGNVDTVEHATCVRCGSCGQVSADTVSTEDVPL